MIRMKSKISLLFIALFFITNIWIDGKFIDPVLDSCQILSIVFLLFGLICKIERFTYWNHSDRNYLLMKRESKKNG